MKNRLIEINAIEKVSRRIVKRSSNNNTQNVSNSETLAAVHTHTHTLCLLNWTKSVKSSYTTVNGIVILTYTLDKSDLLKVALCKVTTLLNEIIKEIRINKRE